MFGESRQIGSDWVGLLLFLLLAADASEHFALGVRHVYPAYAAHRHKSFLVLYRGIPQDQPET